MQENDHSLPDDFPVELPIEESIDLHTFTPRDIPSVVEEYLFQCHQKGFREVRIIHGRGTGTQRAIVHSILRKNPHVSAFHDATPEAGGWGATIAHLLPGGQPEMSNDK